MKKFTLITLFLACSFIINAQCYHYLSKAIEMAIWEPNYDMGKDRYDLFMKYTVKCEQMKTFKQGNGFFIPPPPYAMNHFNDSNRYYQNMKQYLMLHEEQLLLAVGEDTLRTKKINLLNQAIIPSPDDSIAYAHNFMAYGYIADIELLNDNVDTAIFYYQKAESCLNNADETIEREFYYDLISFYYKYANLLISIEEPNTVKSKELFEKCIALAEIHNAEIYIEYCKQIIDEYNL